MMAPLVDTVTLVSTVKVSVGVNLPRNTLTCNSHPPPRIISSLPGPWPQPFISVSTACNWLKLCNHYLQTHTYVFGMRDTQRYSNFLSWSFDSRTVFHTLLCLVFSSKIGPSSRIAENLLEYFMDRQRLVKLLHLGLTADLPARTY